MNRSGFFGVRFDTSLWGSCAAVPVVDRAAPGAPVRRGEVLTERLQGALSSGASIEQAEGAIARMRSGSIDEAFTLPSVSAGITACTRASSRRQSSRTRGRSGVSPPPDSVEGTRPAGSCAPLGMRIVSMCCPGPR